MGPSAPDAPVALTEALDEGARAVDELAFAGGGLGVYVDVGVVDVSCDAYAAVGCAPTDPLVRTGVEACTGWAIERRCTGCRRMRFLPANAA
jgi:hypothetical protein